MRVMGETVLPFTGSTLKRRIVNPVLRLLSLRIGLEGLSFRQEFAFELNGLFHILACGFASYLPGPDRSKNVRIAFIDGKVL